MFSILRTNGDCSVWHLSKGAAKGVGRRVSSAYVSKDKMLLPDPLKPRASARALTGKEQSRQQPSPHALAVKLKKERG